jgi:hypothetical protein
MVYWSTQEVVGALLGGCCIAAATSINLYLYGRITGLSGIFNSIVKLDKEHGFDWKTCFFVGLLTIPVLFNQICGNVLSIGDFKYLLFDFDIIVNQQ